METKNKKTTQENKHSKQKFNAVEFMREQRDKISKSIADLTPDEILKHFAEIKNTTNIRPSA
ncbi:MAG: hypothetical protein U0V49_01080 [Saprospiraceae bacterium]